MKAFPRGTQIPNPPNKLVVFPHLEMGDALIVNGLCRTLAATTNSMIWMTDVKYVFDVRRMYEDLPQVQVLGALGYDDIRNRWIPSCLDAKRLGLFADAGFNLDRWDESFYHQLGIDFNLRWSSFQLPPSLRMAEPTQKEPVALIHEDPSRAFNVVRQLLPAGLKHIFITSRPSFWDWMPQMLAVQEVHCIDSAYLNLVESLYALGYLRNTKLVWHAYAKRYTQSGPPQMRAPWHIFR
jgi:hypothetical protein